MSPAPENTFLIISTQSYEAEIYNVTIMETILPRVQILFLLVPEQFIYLYLRFPSGKTTKELLPQTHVLKKYLISERYLA